MSRNRYYHLFRMVLLTTCAHSLSYAFAQEMDAETLLEEEAPSRARDAAELARLLGVSGDDRRPNDQLAVKIWGRDLTIGGELEAAGQSRDGTELDPDADDGDARLTPEAQVELLYEISDNVVAFAEVKLAHQSDVWREGGGRESETSLELREAWLLLKSPDVDGLALQIGRQQFQDRREWWWDANLDAVRLHFFRERISGFIGVAEDFGPLSTLDEDQDASDEDIRRLLGNLGWTLDKRNRLDAFVLHQDDYSSEFEEGDEVEDADADESDADLWWLGVRYRGRAKFNDAAKFYILADAAMVRGSERITEFNEAPDGNLEAGETEEFDVEGWALDASVSWEIPIEAEPVLTFAFARGSGDEDESDNRDESFRQTGLNGNNGKYRGISRFRYYGEALRPELSNLSVASVSLGVPIGETWWVESSLRDYQQVNASTNFRSDRLDAAPLGLDTGIGQGADLIVSYEEGSRWEFEASLGVFRSGEAFGDQSGEWVHGFSVKIDYNF